MEAKLLEQSKVKFHLSQMAEVLVINWAADLGVAQEFFKEVCGRILEEWDHPRSHDFTSIRSHLAALRVGSSALKGATETEKAFFCVDLFVEKGVDFVRAVVGEPRAKEPTIQVDRLIHKVGLVRLHRVRWLVLHRRKQQVNGREKRGDGRFLLMKRISEPQQALEGVDIHQAKKQIPICFCVQRQDISLLPSTKQTLLKKPLPLSKGTVRGDLLPSCQRFVGRR